MDKLKLTSEQSAIFKRCSDLRKGQKIEIKDPDGSVWSESLDKITFVNYLASGSFGWVFAARIGNRDGFAIKLGRPGPSNKIDKEFAIGSQLGSLGIAPQLYIGYPCHDTGGKSSREGILMISELIPSGSLLWKDTLTRGKITWKAAKGLYDKITKMHELGIIHCDMKPENLLVKRLDDGTVTDIYITDFGMSYRIGKDKVMSDPWFVFKGYASSVPILRQLAVEKLVWVDDVWLKPLNKGSDMWPDYWVFILICCVNNYGDLLKPLLDKYPNIFHSKANAKELISLTVDSKSHYMLDAKNWEHALEYCSDYDKSHFLSDV